MSRWWGKNIEIDGNWTVRGEAWARREQQQWEIDVQEVFRTIERSQLGGRLLSLINKIDGKSICVVPIDRSDTHETRARPMDWTPAVRKDHYFECSRGETCSRNPLSPHSALLSGTGTGVRVVLYFHPASWISTANMRAVDEVAGVDMRRHNYRPDNVLFHECVHAYRMLRGLFEVVPTGDTWHFTEELFAITLTNIYVSESSPGLELRGSHEAQFNTLKDTGNSTEPNFFYYRYHREIVQMLDEMGDLVDPLTGDPPKFSKPTWNPFRTSTPIDRTVGSIFSGF